MLDGAAEAQRDFDPPLVVPADVGVHRRDELLDGRGQPLPRVEQLGLQAAEEAFARRVVWRVPLSRHRANQLRIRNAGTARQATLRHDRTDRLGVLQILLSRCLFKPADRRDSR
jgi:hypothetical protein